VRFTPAGETVVGTHWWLPELIRNPAVKRASVRDI
jgi:hypothetical protein